jgi:transposase
MEKTDARKHDQNTQYEIRKQIIRLRKQGVSNQVVAQGLGISEQHASTIWQRYRKHGAQAIKPGKRGRRTGEKRKLSAVQEKEIRRLLVDKMPDQMKFPFALWTREAVRLLIKDRFKFEMPIRTVGEYLKRWGFTPQKPVKRAYEQRPKEVQRWLETEYPVIQAKAKEEKAEIHWGDETGIQTGANRQRGYSLKGVAPVVPVSVKKSRISMLSSITNGGKVRFMLYRDAMNSKLLLKFMKRLIKDTEKKLFLILDNLPVHHSKEVKKWLEKNKEEIEVFYLPSYSPELNPDEYLNGDLKGRVHSGSLARNEHDLIKKTRSFMKRLQKRPKHVRNYFKHHNVAYAA